MFKFYDHEGPFSKTAVNFNAGCKTAMSNIVMAICMALTLLFLASLFKYTPLVALSAIIMSAMFGLIDYEAAYHLFKVDKFDFVICMAAFFGVAFISMDVGLMLSVCNIYIYFTSFDHLIYGAGRERKMIFFFFVQVDQIK